MQTSSKCRETTTKENVLDTSIPPPPTNWQTVIIMTLSKFAVQAQLGELGNLQQTLYDLERNHTKVKQTYVRLTGNRHKKISHSSKPTFTDWRKRC